jgi:hypothetical protein
MTVVVKNCSGIPTTEGRVRVNADCCCGECSCDCECAVEVTILGVTFNADGQKNVLCVTDATGNANLLVYPFSPGDAAVAVAWAVVECSPCGSVRVSVYNQYLQILKDLNGTLPAVGDPYTYSFNGDGGAYPEGFLSAAVVWTFHFPSCNECGCPNGSAVFDPLGIRSQTLDLSDNFPDKPCTSEVRGPTRQVPVITAICDECE